MNQTSIERLVEEFSKLHYEPEHFQTTCWCNPKFLNKDGVLHIEHNEQRVILKDWLRSALSQARQEGREEVLKQVLNLSRDLYAEEDGIDGAFIETREVEDLLALTTEGK